MRDSSCLREAHVGDAGVHVSPQHRQGPVSPEVNERVPREIEREACDAVGSHE